MAGLYIAAITIVASILIGCQSSDSYVSAPSQAKSNPATWTPTLAPDDVKTLSPDEAKAILLARAVVEKNAKLNGKAAPQILHFYLKATSAGWDVHVEYVAIWKNGEPSSAPSFFTDLFIGRDWQVINVVGGA